MQLNHCKVRGIPNRTRATRPLTLLILTCLLVFTSGSVPAQSTDEELAVIVLTGQNRDRTVAGALNVECGYDTEPHSAPFGNWGVASNYGDISDTDQFRGWKYEEGPRTKLHWNSCTTRKSEYQAPNCSYYNANNCTTQASSATVTHGVMAFRTSSTPCPTPGTVGNEVGTGCRVFEGVRIAQISNHMTLYELDGWHKIGLGNRSVDGHDLVETLYFPETVLTLRGCTHDECPEQTSGWVTMTSSSSSTVRVEAELWVKAKATLHGFCDWDSGE